MTRILPLLAVMVLSPPAFAQMDHATMDHATSDHGEDHNHPETAMTSAATSGALMLAAQPELSDALKAGGEPVVASVLGAVCDFCAMAMNKTFGKRDEVAAVYVDLDAKTLNLVLKPGASFSDELIRKTVKKSGYQVSDIARGVSVIAE